MGNAVISPACFKPNPNNSAAKLILFDGTTRSLAGKTRIAGEFMFEFPDSMVCHADSFYLGHHVPALGIHDELLRGQTYFLLPIDGFASGVLSASSLASFAATSSPSPNNDTHAKPTAAGGSPINFGTAAPFEYLKGSNGRVLIKVSPEFIASLIMRGKGTDSSGNNSPNSGGGFLCSTPELQKHYEQLVGSKEQLWSPKLETISEHKIRFSPCRFIGLDWKIKEKRNIEI